MKYAISLRVAAVAAVFAIAAACATSPLGRRQLILVSSSQLEQMGASAFEQMKSEGKLSADTRATQYVSCVAGAITRILTSDQGGAHGWELRVFDDETANAFALPGKKIGVHTGLLEVAQNQHQLATVIGHEIAHVYARHSAERVSTQVAAQGLGVILAAAGNPDSPYFALTQQALGLGQLAYGRTQESEADRIGLDLMAEAGFDPRQSVPLWQNMAAATASQGQRPPEFLSTHPSPETRIRDLQQRTRAISLGIAQKAWAAGRRPSC